MSEDQTPAQLRDALEAANKESKRLQKMLGETQAELKSMKAHSAFTEAGLSSNLADLFVAAKPDVDEITVDAVKEFASEYGISGASDPEEGSDDGAGHNDPAATEGLDNFARAGSRAGGEGQPPASTKYLTRDEFLRTKQSDPVAAQKALAEGRVRLRNDNPYATGSVPVAGENPFASQHAVSEE